MTTDFQVPRITAEKVDDRRGTFTIEPLDKGFGYTFGNSLRRVLLSSLGGAAITSVRIEGVVARVLDRPRRQRGRHRHRPEPEGPRRPHAHRCRRGRGAAGGDRPRRGEGEGHRPALRRRDPQPRGADRDAREKNQTRGLPDDRPRPRLLARRREQVGRAADRRDPDRLDLLADPPRVLRRLRRPRRAADRLRQTRARPRDRRLDRAGCRAARGLRDPDQEPGDLHRRRPGRGTDRA